jgi:type IV pilus biogenesis protein CpaD/CtpE
MSFRLPCATAVAAFAVLAGCTSPPPTATAANPAVKTAQAEQQVCTREVPVGSLMPVTRCRTRAQAERDEDEARKALGFTRQTGGEAAPDRVGR